MPFAVVAGAVLAAGAKVANKKSKRDANRRAARNIKYNPWSMDTGIGSVGVDPLTRKMTAGFDPTTQNMRDLMMSNASMFGGQDAPNMALANWGFNQANTDMPGAYAGAQDSLSLNPYALNQYDQQMGMGMGNMFGAAQGALGQAGRYAMGMGPGQMESQMMFGQGMGLLGSQPQSYQQVADQQLALLRQQAAPQEEQSRNALMNKLFSMGQLGGSGGGMMLNQFGQGLGQADLARQVTAQNFGNSLYSQDLQASLQRQGIGANLMQGGQQGMFQGTELMNQLGQTGIQGMGMYGDMANQMYSNRMGYQDAIASRGQQRMANAMQLFGLGSDAYTQNVQNLNQLNQGMLGHSAQLIDLMGLSSKQGEIEANVGAMKGPYTAKTAGSVWADSASAVGGLLTKFGMSGGGGG